MSKINEGQGGQSRCNTGEKEITKVEDEHARS